MWQNGPGKCARNHHTLAPNISVPEMFLQTKSGNAAFISSIAYATCSWCVQTLASLVWKQKDLWHNEDTVKFARQSNSSKHRIFLCIINHHYNSLECGGVWYPPMHTGPARASLTPPYAARVPGHQASVQKPEMAQGLHRLAHVEPWRETTHTKVKNEKTKMVGQCWPFEA